MLLAVVAHSHCFDLDWVRDEVMIRNRIKVRVGHTDLPILNLGCGKGWGGSLNWGRS